jgi:hypothetical protein
MSYGIKYKFNLLDISGSTYQVNLNKINYTGATTEIKYYAPQPLKINYKSGRDEIDNPIKGSGLEFTFYAASGQSFTDLLESEYQDWQVEVLNTNLTPIKYWEGWLQPENITTNVLTSSYFITINAVDGLANLKNIDYPYALGLTNTTPLIQMVKKCLTQTGIALPIAVQCNVLPTQLSGSTLFDKVLGNERRFANFDKQTIYYLSCYDALSKILNSFNCFIAQSNGQYVITQRNETSSSRTVYDWNYLTGVTSFYNRLLTLNPKVKIGSDELSKIRPFKKTYLNYYVFDSGRYVPDSVLNGLFNLNTTGWSNESAPYAHNSISYDSSNKRLTAADSWAFSGTSFPHSTAIKSPVFAVNINSGTTITVNVSMLVTYLTYYGGGTGGYPTIRCELMLSGNTVSYQDLPYVPVFNTLNNYTFNLAYTQSGNHNLRIWMSPFNYGVIQNITQQYDNILVFKNYKSDKAYQLQTTGTVDNSTAIAVDTQDQYFGDGSSIYEVGALQYAPSALTTTWVNYGYRNQFPSVNFSDPNYFNATFGSSLTPFSQSSLGGDNFTWISSGHIRAGNGATSALSNFLYVNNIFDAGSYSLRVIGTNNSTGAAASFLQCSVAPVSTGVPIGSATNISTGAFDRQVNFTLSSKTIGIGFYFNVPLPSLIQVDLSQVFISKAPLNNNWLQESTGVTWQYSGNTIAPTTMAVVNGNGVASQYLMAGVFPQGTYKLQFKIKNQKGIALAELYSKSLSIGSYNLIAGWTPILTGTTYTTYSTGYFSTNDDCELGIKIKNIAGGATSMLTVIDDLEVLYTSTNIINNLTQLNLFNKQKRSSKFRSYLRIDVKDNSQIKINSLLSFGGKTYEVIALEYDVQGCWATLELAQVLSNGITTTTVTNIVT